MNRQNPAVSTICSLNQRASSARPPSVRPFTHLPGPPLARHGVTTTTDSLTHTHRPASPADQTNTPYRQISTPVSTYSTNLAHPSAQTPEIHPSSTTVVYTARYEFTQMATDQSIGQCSGRFRLPIETAIRATGSVLPGALLCSRPLTSTPRPVTHAAALHRKQPYTR